jgi:predicted metalloprotease with PDZ domain
MRSLFLPLALIATASSAQTPKSAPLPLPLENLIPAARDIPYPGTMAIRVDATDTVQGVLKVEQTIPLPADAKGRFTLLFPKWLPGKHGPRGEIEKLAGLEFSADGQPVPWVRDPLDVHAFHLTLPAGARTLTARFQFLSATKADQGRITITPEMMNLQPEQVSLYPAGHFTRQIPVSLTVTWPRGWKAAGALRPAATNANTIAYETTDYETLVDSPFFAGQHFRSWDLGENVTLNAFADEARFLAATPEQIDAHKRLVTQTLKAFGAKHYDHYDFLLALTNRMGGIGLEHHRSSENGVNTGYFTDWAAGPGRRNLLPHEFVHSWNGKFRRGADLVTPDYRTPMRNSLLWVYEGQTQFWGYVLGARSGMTSIQDTMDALATIAASLNENRPARQWRPLQDTTNDPIITARAPKGWVSQQRSEDYYNEGLLIWLEVDALLREMTGGKRGIDDFARAFFGVNEGDWGVLPYTTETITNILNDLAPYDWAGFFAERLSQTGTGAPLAGFAKSGYELGWQETPNRAMADSMRTGRFLDLTFSGGLSIGTAGRITQVIWGSPAFAAGLKVGDQLLAVNGQSYTDDALKQALIANKGSATPLSLIVKAEDSVRTTQLLWNQGLRYPILKRSGKGPDWLARLLSPRS